MDAAAACMTTIREIAESDVTYFLAFPSYITWTEPCVQLSFFSRIFEAIMRFHKMDYRLFIPTPIINPSDRPTV